MFNEKQNPLNGVRVETEQVSDFAERTVHWILNGNLDEYKPKRKGLVPPQDGARF